MDLNSQREGLVEYAVSEEAIAKVLEHGYEIACVRMGFDLTKPSSVGSSRTGGVPDFNERVFWPHSQAGLPMRFIAQIRCSELESEKGVVDFKPTGMLWFFVDVDGMGAEGAVLHTSSVGELSPARVPESLRHLEPSPPAAITFARHADFILPVYDFDRFKALGLSEDDCYRFEDYEYEVLDFPIEDRQLYRGNRVMGMPIEAPASAGDMKEWILLASFDPLEDPHSIEALKGVDLGRRINCYLRLQDLVMSQFSRAVFSYSEA